MMVLKEIHYSKRKQGNLLPSLAIQDMNVCFLCGTKAERQRGQSWTRFLFAVCSILCIVSVGGQYCEPKDPCKSCSPHLIRSSTDCNEYNYCLGGNPYSFRCYRTLVLSVKTGTCVPPNSIYNDCHDRPTTQATTTTTRAPPPVWPAIQGGSSSCGVAVTPMIVNGYPANGGQIPWQVSIQERQGSYTSHNCGGVVIDSQWILTAAHCVIGKSASNMYVVVGSVSKTAPASKIVRVSRLYSYPGYSGDQNRGYPNDVGLVKLSSPLQLGGDVGKVCLPASSQTFIGRKCYTSGFGETLGTGNGAILNYVDMKVLTNTQCQTRWTVEAIGSGHICVDNGLSGTCLGDSGGPLVCEVGGRFLLAGITSFGSLSCQGRPSVFTRVTSYVSWIRGTMR